MLFVCLFAGEVRFLNFSRKFFLDLEFLDRWRKISELGVFQSTLHLLVLIVLENSAVILTLASLEVRVFSFFFFFPSRFLFLRFGFGVFVVVVVVLLFCK